MTAQGGLKVAPTVPLTGNAEAIMAALQLKVAGLLSERVALAQAHAQSLWELSRQQQASSELTHALDQAMQTGGGGASLGLFDRRVRAYEQSMMTLEDMESQRYEIKCLKALLRAQMSADTYSTGTSRYTSEVESSSDGEGPLLQVTPNRTTSKRRKNRAARQQSRYGLH